MASAPGSFPLYYLYARVIFQIAEDTTHNRKKASAALKAALAKAPSAVEVIVEFHTCFPAMDEHENHATVGQVSNSIQRKLLFSIVGVRSH